MQIQAYLDNVFDVGGLLEDAETKNVALEKVEELEEHLSHVRAPPTMDHQRCSLRLFTGLLWFVSCVQCIAVSPVAIRILLSVFPFYEFHKLSRVIMSWTWMENIQIYLVL